MDSSRKEKIQKAATDLSQSPNSENYNADDWKARIAAIRSRYGFNTDDIVDVLKIVVHETDKQVIEIANTHGVPLPKRISLIAGHYLKTIPSRIKLRHKT
ncbi:MAG: hypothetical protein WAV41_05770 [Microgenomates group bacterium]